MTPFLQGVGLQHCRYILQNKIFFLTSPACVIRTYKQIQILKSLRFRLFFIVTSLFQINVLDCNDHAPVFEMQQYEASVREGASPGTTVITLKAADQDVGKNAEVIYH